MWISIGVAPAYRQAGSYTANFYSAAGAIIHGKRNHQQGVVNALIAKNFMWIVWNH